MTSGSQVGHQANLENSNEEAYGTLNLVYEEILNELDIFTLEKINQWQDKIVLCKYMGRCHTPQDLIYVTPEQERWNSGLKFQENRFHFNVRKTMS